MNYHYDTTPISKPVINNKQARLQTTEDFLEMGHKYHFTTLSVHNCLYADSIAESCIIINIYCVRK